MAWTQQARSRLGVEDGVGLGVRRQDCREVAFPQARCAGLEAGVSLMPGSALRWAWGLPRPALSARKQGGWSGLPPGAAGSILGT